MAVVARMVASLEAETSQFHARMTAAETQINKWSSSTASGTRATRVLNASIQQLSFHAAGIPGAVGKAASAIAVLGIGGGPVLLAVAAIGALAMAFDHAAKKAEELEVANRSLRDFQQGHIQMLAGIAPEGQLTPVEQIASLRIRRARALEAIKALTPTAFGAVRLPFGTDPTEVARTASQRIDTLTGEVAQFDRAIATLAVTINDAAQKAKLAAIIFAQNEIALERGGVYQALRSGFQAGRFGVESGGALGLPAPAGPTFANIRGNQPRFVPGASGAGAGLPPEFYAMAGLALIQGVQSGSVGGMLGAASGPLAMINPLAGVITGTLGTLFSAFEGRETERERQEERRHKELIGVLHEGPMRVTVLSADDPEADLYAIRHQERLGGEPRLGGL